MATLEELSSALVKADAAGNVEDARALTAEIDRMRGGGVDAASDLGKSAAIGPVKGAIRFAGYPSDIPEMGARGLDVATRYIGGKLGYDIPERENQTPRFGAENLRKNLEEYTGPLYDPKTKAGRIVQATTEALGDPTSYLGPGSYALKAGSAALGQGASEAAGQALPEDSKWQLPARLAAGAAGGFTANKMLGPRAPEAIIPTIEEQAKHETKYWDKLKHSDVAFNPDSVAQRAAQLEQKLLNDTTYDPLGTPRSQAIVERLKATESRSVGANRVGLRAVDDALGGPRITEDPYVSNVRASDLDRIRRQAGNIAGKTEPNKSGRQVPTEDAAVAMVIKKDIEDFFQHPPEGAVLQGDVSKLQRDTKTAKATTKALAPQKDIEYKQLAAEVKSDQGLTGSFGQKLQTRVGDLLLRPRYMKNLSPKAQALIEGINKPSTGQSILNQAARVANYTPVALAVDTVAGHGVPTGASIPGLVIGHAARYFADKHVIHQVDDLMEELAKQSPLYKSRVRNLKPMDTAPGKAAIVRGLLQGLK